MFLLFCELRFFLFNYVRLVFLIIGGLVLVQHAAIVLQGPKIVRCLLTFLFNALANQLRNAR
jgi:hypothetical protein